MQLSTVTDIPVCSVLCQRKNCDKLRECGRPCSRFSFMTVTVLKQVLVKYETVITVMITHIKCRWKGTIVMIAIIDYDAGNLKSVYKALLHLGQEAVITRDVQEIWKADRVILPGVGSFGEAMERLHEYDLVQVIREVAASGKPFLGICLGLQLLFERSEESPGVDGLGILKGEILRIPDTEGLKVPHIGWNSLTFDHPGRLFQGLSPETYVYFVHSYYLKAKEEAIVTASAQYGVNIHASVEKDNVFACQFHPEKSSEAGLRILKNFAEIGEEK